MGGYCSAHQMVPLTTPIPPIHNAACLITRVVARFVTLEV